jgi:glycine/D-amino acid oxidase-like deaminating enzyme
VIALQNGAEIFPAMLAAIRSARHSVTFETYIYWSGTIGKEIAEARRAAGLYAEYLTRARLQERFGIARAGAILSSGNLALDPRQLTAGLLLCAIERGARCHAPTKATIIEVDSRPLPTRIRDALA